MTSTSSYADDDCSIRSKHGKWLNRDHAMTRVGFAISQPTISIDPNSTESLPLKGDRIAQASVETRLL
jgi:hypothetical protein